MSLFSNSATTPTGPLKGLKVAILATDGFEQAELIEPRNALQQAGAEVIVVSPKSGKIQGMVFSEKGKTISVDLELSKANATDFDALVLPGGVANPDDLRADEKAVAFVREIVDAGKPVAAICHGPWTLIEVDFVRGKEMTSWKSLKTDLQNAGAKWIDASVVVSDGLITSRCPDDLPDFNREMIRVFGTPRDLHAPSVDGEALSEARPETQPGTRKAAFEADVQLY